MSMTPKAPGKRADIGVPKRDQIRENQAVPKGSDQRQYVQRDRALEMATALANRNAELMRRLA